MIERMREAAWNAFMASPVTDHKTFKTMKDAVDAASLAHPGYGFTTGEGTLWIAPISFFPNLRDAILCSSRPGGNFSVSSGRSNQAQWQEQCVNFADQFFASLHTNYAAIERKDFDAAIQSARDALAPLVAEEAARAKAQGAGQGAA